MRKKYTLFKSQNKTKIMKCIKKLASWVGNDKTSFHTEFQPQV